MNINEIRNAARRNAGHVRRTPLLTSPFLDEIAGRRIYVKPECLQHTGSFKYRGAHNAISQLTADQREMGVIAFRLAITRRASRWRRARTRRRRPS